MSGNVKTEERVRQSFAQQAEWCGRLGSPFMQKLMSGLGTGLDRSTATGDKILSWQGEPNAKGDAVALRLAGALHGAVRRGELPKLAAFYQPGADCSQAQLTGAALQAIQDKDEEFLHWLNFAPQTNEVRRAAIIYAGLLTFNSQHSLPVSLYELGASAGLNLSLAEFEYQFGKKVFGNANSGVKLSPDWRGVLPVANPINVVSKRGCDLNPLFVENSEDRGRLLSYLWPDQPERLARTEAAIEIALADPPKLDKTPADVWVEAVLEEEPEAGVARVFYHTIAWQYFPQLAKDKIRSAFEFHGRLSTNSTPLVWLSFEMVENNAPELVMQVWPNGDIHRLAGANAHVEWIEWFK